LKNNFSTEANNTLPKYISRFIEAGKSTVDISNIKILANENSYASFMFEVNGEKVFIIGFQGYHDDIDRNTALKAILAERKKIPSAEEAKRGIPLILVASQKAHFVKEYEGQMKGVVKRQMIDLVRIVYPNEMGETLRLVLSPLSKLRFWPHIFPKRLVKGLERLPLSRELSALYQYDDEDEEGIKKHLSTKNILLE
jgi:hypothetical protein